MTNRTYKNTEIRTFYKGRIPYEVGIALKKYKTWVELKVNPKKIDTNINEFSFIGKPEKPRFDKIVRNIRAGRIITPILIEKRITPQRAKQVAGATFDRPIDGYARVAAHKKLNKSIKILIPEKKTTKKQPDVKLSQHDKWLLAGEYKIRDKPKEVRNLGKPVTSGLKKATKTKPKTKPKKRTRTKPKPQSPFDFTIQETLFEGVLR